LYQFVPGTNPHKWEASFVRITSVEKSAVFFKLYPPEDQFEKKPFYSKSINLILTRFFAFVLIPNETNCMSQKAPLPSLTGHRLKTRKRDEKKQYDPTGFRDAILEGLEAAGDDLEAVSKFLDVSGSKLDYRRYGVNLIEILIAGGLLAPGGIISTEGENGEAKVRTNICLFGLADSMEKVKAFEQVFVKLMRRYKYLEKMHEEEMRKILVYLNGFTDEERLRLAEITAVWLATGQIPPSTLSVLINEHQVKDGMALKFFMDTLVTLKAEKGGNAVTTAIKRSGIESRLMEFFPPTGNQQTEENFIKTFKGNSLKTTFLNIVKFKIWEIYQRVMSTKPLGDLEGFTLSLHMFFFLQANIMVQPWSYQLLSCSPSIKGSV